MLFVFLVLAAQYESWALPLAIVLIVPMSVLSALVGVRLRGQDNNILTQIGLVVLVGLAAKNAILIVEFAKQAEEAGRTPVEAVVEACRLRLRPILMTAFAFILGVVPLVIATGPGAEMRRALGTAVFFGMLGVTFFGLFLTPVFYVAIRAFVLWLGRRKAPPPRRGARARPGTGRANQPRSREIQRRARAYSGTTVAFRRATEGDVLDDAHHPRDRRRRRRRNRGPRAGRSHRDAQAGHEGRRRRHQDRLGHGQGRGAVRRRQGERDPAGLRERR